MVDLPPEEALQFREICTSEGYASDALCRVDLQADPVAQAQLRSAHRTEHDRFSHQVLGLDRRLFHLRRVQGAPFSILFRLQLPT